MERCAMNYITQSRVNYRVAVRHFNLPIFHVDDSALHSNSEMDDFDDAPALAHTSPFRWITFLGRQLGSASGPTNSKFDAPRLKYRSDSRRSLLATCFDRLSSGV
jgi:hypothetical protein